jgi:two-component system response regulator AtoC
MTSWRIQDRIPRTGRVLVGVGDSKLGASLSELLLREGHQVKTAGDEDQVLEILAREGTDAILLDEEWTGSLLGRIRSAYPEVQIVVAAGEGGASSGRPGAQAWIVERAASSAENAQRFSAAARRALERKWLLARVLQLESELQERYHLPNVIAVSPAMREVLSQVRRLTDEDSNLLIEGEAGTGKELIARTIHYMGPRREQPFVTVRCSELPRGKLVGRSGLPGDSNSVADLVRRADAGTIFLDDVGALGAEARSKILRAGEGEAGGDAPAPGADRGVPRWIMTTSADLGATLRNRNFRGDLLRILKVACLRLPPLRERREDIPSLVHHFIHNRVGESSTAKAIDPAALRLLCRYEWPGNIQELEDCIGFSVAMASGESVGIEDLPDRLVDAVRRHGPAASEGPLSLKAYEKITIEQAMALCDGDIQRTSRMLGIGRSTLYRKMKAHGIRRRLFLRRARSSPSGSEKPPVTVRSKKGAA